MHIEFAARKESQDWSAISKVERWMWDEVTEVWDETDVSVSGTQKNKENMGKFSEHKWWEEIVLVRKDGESF